ncbi:MAG TPA: PKD domain-containing protein [Verrucomicrobiae bacterium]|jgi:PKD repeat protein|nr:PKD domain-containing protein [Verrucomicrobiae bacterium]
MNRPLQLFSALLPVFAVVAAPISPSELDASLTPDGQQVKLHWKSVPGQTQQIQVSSDLRTWTKLPPVLASALDDSTWADDGSLTGSFTNAQRYYRLLLGAGTISAWVGAPISFAPAAVGSAYLWDFGDGATATSQSPSHIYQADGVYTVTLAVTDANGTHAGASTIWAESPCQSLLTPSLLAALRQKAASNTTQWQSFNQRLNGQLKQVVGSGAYEGDELSWIGDYALGYKVLEFQDPATAAMYADKAIGLLKSALQDFQKVGEIAQMFLARGDGVTKSFTLPDTNIIGSSLSVYTAPITNLAVVRGSGPTDAIDYYLTFIKVSQTSDGAADYMPGVDWRHSGDLPNDEIDWSIAAPGRSPARGTTYYVTAASSLDIANASAGLSGNTLTFSTAPSVKKAIYVQYVYGAHASNNATLAFQQTHANDGGFNSVTIDDGYTYRYLGKFAALGCDWLYGYPGLTASLRSQLAAMLVRWSDYWKANGYRADDPASNYAEGGYVSRTLTALALGAGRDTNGPRLLSEITAFRQANVLPVITNASDSYAGGFWAEGWNYGQQAARNLILAGLALETAGTGTIAPERQWAGEVINSLISEQPSQRLIYDGGDWYDYPAPFVDKDLLYMTAAAAADPVARSHANYIIQNYPGGQTQDMQDLCYRDPSAGAAFWSDAPLARVAQGTGLVTARADWSYNSTWLAFQVGNLIDTDHQEYAQGQLEVQRGPDALLINANEVGGNQNVNTESSFGNLVAVDDNGAGTQNYPFNQGFWFGAPGCRITAFEDGGQYVYAMGDYAAAYALNTTPGVGTARKLTRQVVYVRPDYIVAHDRAVTQAAADAKELRWHFLDAPAVQPASNSWVAAEGGSKLFGQTFSRSPLATTNEAVNCPADGDAVVYRVATRNTVLATNVNYLTVLQSAAASTASMAATAPVSSSDLRMEGAQIGNTVILCGADAPLTPFSGTITYSVTNAAPTIHFLCDLPAGQAFQVSANGISLGSFKASASGVLSFTNIRTGAQTIALH